MAKTNRDGDTSQITELLEKMLVMQMYDMGATQNQIAKTVSRQTLWVNRLLKRISRRQESK